MNCFWTKEVLCPSWSPEVFCFFPGGPGDPPLSSIHAQSSLFGHPQLGSGPGTHSREGRRSPHASPSGSPRSPRAGRITTPSVPTGASAGAPGGGHSPEKRTEVRAKTGTEIFWSLFSQLQFDGIFVGGGGIFLQVGATGGGSRPFMREVVRSGSGCI